MTQHSSYSRFETTLLSAVDATADQPWAFVVLPKAVSGTLPRRGRTSVEGVINQQAFQATLEPDGQLSHWLRIEPPLLDAINAMPGDTIDVQLKAVEQEPEPPVPDDLREALDASPAAKAVWLDTTTIARLDWIHWVTTAKQLKTRVKRIHDACNMLESGKKRVCCFDPSGFYSKALSAPKAKTL